MRFARLRSGLHESFEDVTTIALDEVGTVLLSSGEVDAPLYYRSAIKPFQALAAARTGLALPDEHLAVTCSSHGGFPVHVAIVDAVLTDHGLTSDDLQCPPARPPSREAHEQLLLSGIRDKQRRFHTCSGKHAGWLAACVVARWDTSTYLEPDHPLQRSILTIMREASGLDPAPVGVDGCGAPALRGSVRGLARAFGRLGADDELAPMARATARFGALVADNMRPDGRVAAWWGGPQKVGAEGIFAMTRGGVTIVAKSHSGKSEVAIAGALTTAHKIGVLSQGAADALEDEMSPPVIGAGRIVGRMELIDS